MSQWTHVAGCIRVDAIRPLGFTAAVLESVLGPIIRYEDLEPGRETMLPMGSEGSLEYAIEENPNPHSAAAYAVCVWGDLRDYDDTEKLLAWFKRIVLDEPDRTVPPFLIRDAVMVIDVEAGPRVIGVLLRPEDGENTVEFMWVRGSVPGILLVPGSREQEMAT